MHLNDACVGDPRNLSLEFVQGRVLSERGFTLFRSHVLQKNGVMRKVTACGHGAMLRGDSCLSLSALHLIHGNKQFSLKRKVLLRSLASAVSGSRTFICNLISTQSAQITPVIVFSAGNVLLREEAVRSEAHLAKYINVWWGGNP